MSNKIAKINAKNLAVVQQKNTVITVEEALDAAKESGVPLNLVRSWHNRATVGKYAASGSAGNIIAKSIIIEDEGRRISKVLVGMVEAPIRITGDAEEISAALESKTKAADAWAKVNGLLTERDLLDIKATEVEGIVKTSDRRENLAPQRGSPMQFITPGPIQINNGKQ